MQAFSGPMIHVASSHPSVSRNGGRNKLGTKEDARGVSGRDISQIKRLSYLVDAREAKVQAVLDEAMSWLIAPFASHEEEVPSETAPGADFPGTPSPAPGEREGECLLPLDKEAIQKENIGGEATTLKEIELSPGPSAASGSMLAILAQGKDLEVAPDVKNDTVQREKLQQTISMIASPVPEPEKVEFPSAVGGDNGAGWGPGAEDLSCLCFLNEEPTDHEVEEKRTAAILAESSPEPETVIPRNAKPDIILASLSFPTEDLEKLDAEAAWDELEADDELHADDYLFHHLPKLVSASPVLASASAALRRPGLAVPGAAWAGAAESSPKRKRGRPKGSGKKTKARLDSAVLASPSASAVKYGAAEISLPGLASQDSPALQSYDSHSPGAITLADSPPSLWSGGSCAPSDILTAASDIMERSGDLTGMLMSPATPSSGASSMLRSLSAASVHSSGDDLSTMPVVPSRTCARSTRPANVQARRLTFSVEEDIPEDSPAFVPAPMPKKSKGKTGRPRGRPRKVQLPESSLPTENP